ncbi:bacteriocin [Bacillus sp. JJ864]
MNLTTNEIKTSKLQSLNEKELKEINGGVARAIGAELGIKAAEWLKSKFK